MNKEEHLDSESQNQLTKGMKVYVQHVDMTRAMFGLRCEECKNWGKDCDQTRHYEACFVVKSLNKILSERILGCAIKGVTDSLSMPCQYIIYVDFSRLSGKSPYLEFCRKLKEEYSRQ